MILLWIPVLIFAYIKMIDPGKKRKHPVLNVKYYAHRGFHGEEGIPEIIPESELRVIPVGRDPDVILKDG